MSTTDAPTYNVDEPKEQVIVNWRADCFLGAGLDLAHALALAIRRDVDRVVVERLLSRGASSAQVVAILL